MARAKITLYLDVVSPFGYMAFYITRHTKLFQNIDINYVPIFLGGLMKACDNRPPLSIKNKDKWINAERLRWASDFSIPIVTASPEGFPPLTLNTQRALCALQINHPNSIPAALDALYSAFWATGTSPSIGKPETFGPILATVPGGADAVAQMGSPEAKARLAANTDVALADGAFGIPWYACENAEGVKESFWGFDHLGQVCRFLGVEGKPEVSGVLGMRSML